MNIVFRYVSVFFQRRAMRKTIKRINRKFTPEEIAESFIMSMPLYPHQEKQRTKEMSKFIQDYRTKNPMTSEQKVRLDEMAERFKREDENL